MSKRLCLAFIALALLLCLHPLNAVGQTVLTFDDLPSGGYAIPNGYGGLNWDSMNYENWNLNNTAGTGFQYGAVSGTNTAFNLFAAVATVSDSPFNFVGAYLTGAWNDGLNITVTGYKNSIQLYSQTVVASFFVPTFFEFDFINIDTVTFNSFGGTPQSTPAGGAGTHFVMDNFTFEPVPEPSTLALLSLGALGLLARRRFGGVQNGV